MASHVVPRGPVELADMAPIVVEQRAFLASPFVAFVVVEAMCHAGRNGGGVAGWYGSVSFGNKLPGKIYPLPPVLPVTSAAREMYPIPLVTCCQGYHSPGLRR